MSGVNYHAWTHRPKALGGTDPIEVASSVLQLVSVRGSAAFPITVPNNTWTDISGVNWSSVYEQGDGNRIHVNTTVNPDQIQFWSGAVFTFSGCIEWGSTFTGNRMIQIFPSGSLFPEGSGANMIDLGPEGNNNTFGTTFMGQGSSPDILGFQVWQNSGSSKTVTGDTSFLLVLLGNVE